ncbi:MAG: hypothetical protein JJU12_07370 [Chlamydiales bacterium]|nr:hypothetical protein [Chlamydiales bacterium]
MKRLLILAATSLSICLNLSALGHEEIALPESLSPASPDCVYEPYPPFQVYQSGGSCYEPCCENFVSPYSFCDPSSCKNFFLEIDYLYWKARSDQLPYAISFPPDDDVILRTAKFVRVDPQYSSGVRLGVGGFLPCLENWVFLAEWTYYHSLTKEEHQGEMNPIWTNPVGNPLADLAEAEYALTVNFADFSFEGTFCPAQKLKVSPSIGARAAWVDQYLDVGYFGGNIEEGLISKNQFDLRGGGIRAGLSTEWNIFNCFSLVGWSNLDLLWSKIDIFQRDIEFDTGNTRAVEKDTIYTMIPIFELFLGAYWEGEFSCVKLRGRIGWEGQYLFNGVQMNQFTERNDDRVLVHQIGSLSLGGFTMGLSVGF